MSFSDMPVEVGPVYEGERIRAKQMQVELGGPKSEKKFELVRVRKSSEIKDNEVVINGPDLNEMEKGSTHPIGILVEVAGPELETDIEAVLERRIHEFVNFCEGFMHLNQRNQNWIRLSQKSYEKGFNSFKFLGTILIRLFKAELPIVKQAQVTFFTTADKIGDPHAEAMKVYNDRDDRARGLHDEDVDTFYGCVLCQSFAPSHACIITPDRTSSCGSISWFDARAAAKVDPKGPLFAIEPGERLEELAGEYTGINESAKKRSLGEVEKVWLYSAMENPHTSCGCFEAIYFYIPEVDGFGVVDRSYDGAAINGLPFSAMANQTGGGKQLAGFNGISVQYLASPKFVQYEGGHSKTVWMPASVKERMYDLLPEKWRDLMATEKEVTDLNGLKTWLKEKNHPIVESWVDEAEDEDEWEEEGAMIPAGTQTMMIPGAGGMGGFKLTLINCKIHAEKIIVTKIEPRKKRK